MAEKTEKAKECDCIPKLAENIKEKIKKDKSERVKGFNLIKGNWEHYSFYPKTRLYSDFIIESTFEKKDGSTSKPKKDSVSIFYSYCPFCGKRYPETKES